MNGEAYPMPIFLDAAQKRELAVLVATTLCLTVDAESMEENRQGHGIGEK